MKKLFHNKARSLILHQKPILLLKSWSLYTALTHPWMMKCKCKEPLVALLQLKKLIPKHLRKKQIFWAWFIKVPKKEKIYFNRSCFFNFKWYVSYSEAITGTWFIKGDALISRLSSEKYQFAFQTDIALYGFNTLYISIKIKLLYKSVHLACI